MAAPKTTNGNNRVKNICMTLSLLLLASAASSQQMPEFLGQEPGSLGEGWAGFADYAFLINASLTLILAAVLGAIIAYHPRHLHTADTPAEIEAPKVYILYSVIGALIGIMVVKYGLVVGFVLFGIGGLIRFRTVLRSANLTGHVIFVTLIGLSCGLDLPHVAVLATVFGFILIYILDARITYRIDIKGVAPDRLPAAAAAYRAALEGQGCRVMSERKSPDRERIRFIFRPERQVTSKELERLIEADVDESLRGSVDWQID